jgi:hypothetical protein
MSAGDGGWGALITFLPQKRGDCLSAVYDELQLCKGLSLGAVFTLVCPSRYWRTTANWSGLRPARVALSARISVGTEIPNSSGTVLESGCHVQIPVLVLAWNFCANLAPFQAVIHPTAIVHPEAQLARRC